MQIVFDTADNEPSCLTSNKLSSRLEWSISVGRHSFLLTNIQIAQIGANGNKQINNKLYCSTILAGAQGTKSTTLLISFSPEFVSITIHIFRLNVELLPPTVQQFNFIPHSFLFGRMTDSLRFEKGIKNLE